MAKGIRNWAHANAHLMLRGEQQVTSKLTDAAVRIIRFEFDAKLATQRQLAARFNVSQTLVAQVTRREIWKHVT